MDRSARARRRTRGTDIPLTFRALRPPVPPAQDPVVPDPVEVFRTALEAHLTTLSAGEGPKPGADERLTEQLRSVAPLARPHQREMLLDLVQRWEAATELLLETVESQLQRARATRRATRSYAPLRSHKSDQHLSRKV
jgi:hypothetical protein